MLKHLVISILFISLISSVQSEQLVINFAVDKTMKDICIKQKAIVLLFLKKKGLKEKMFDMMLKFYGKKHPFEVINSKFKNISKFMDQQGITRDNIKVAKIDLNGQINVIKSNGKVINGKVVI